MSKAMSSFGGLGRIFENSQTKKIVKNSKNSKKSQIINKKSQTPKSWTSPFGDMAPGLI
jgi:hypothetical protein